jgi:hypothetical protein
VSCSAAPRRRELASAARKAARLVAPAVKAITAALVRAEVAHFDESGFRTAGKLFWVHSASSGRWALVTVHPKRGKDGMEAAGVLPAFAGIAVHDAWKPCDSVAGVAGHDTIDQETLDRQAKWDAAAAATGIALNAGRKGRLQEKRHALATRMTSRADDYLRYTRDLRVPFDKPGVAYCTSLGRSGGSGAAQTVGRSRFRLSGLVCGLLAVEPGSAGLAGWGRAGCRASGLIVIALPAD